ncbi:PQQ-dependent sugar dehydrogenase [Planctomicrobium sp. SH527]|uniref:PQQ-dependent sugar dehydrogenase n=1 Tax=Planctomicrobium sp. SH527 TaxID=3448123 RepID=UPI003F5C0602
MKRSAFWLPACLALCASTLPAVAAEPNQLTQNEELAGWKLLFDGKTTSGWRNYKSDKVSNGWVVEDGALVRKDKGAGDIVSEEQYDAFELLLDYKISPAGNSGLMFHVQETEQRPYQTGPEIQIQDNVEGKDAQKAGWLYQLHQPAKDRVTGEILDATRPTGEWNQLYVRVAPGSGEVAVNGVRYYTFNKGSADWNKRVANSKFKDWANFGKPDTGHICLQDHNDLVSFRNIKVRKLAPGGKAPDISTSELPLKSTLAFPNLKLDKWSPETENGVPRAFRPIVVTAPKDGSNRLFVADQHGLIWSFDNKADVKESKLVLDISDRVAYSDKQNEEGFLGLTFHPKFKENGYIYVNYTPKSTLQTNVSRFQLSKTDPTKFDPASEKIIYTIKQPFWNHNGGTVIFGPDGFLYIALGDGGAGNDPFDNAQNLSSHFGKILRIDVDREENGKAYAIPADNPFVGKEGAAPEIYAYGFRNVWRMAFDSKTNVLWAADVGQNIWEEIDLVVKGGNYGWSRREGTHPFGNKVVDESSFIDPIWEYDHQVGKSITGGFVYRGKALPELEGKYVYADYVTGKIWALNYDAAAKKVISNEAIPGQAMPVLSFGDDAQGEIYFCIVSPNGQGIYKFEKK